MPVDPSIIMGIQPVQAPNMLDMQQKALTMKHLAQTTQIQDRTIADDQAVRSAFQKNTVPGPDGTPTVNRAGVMSDLINTAPMKAIDQQKQWQAQDTEVLNQKLKQIDDRHKMAKDIAWSIPTDAKTPLEQKQAAWTQAKQQAIQAGLPGAQNSPDQYPGDDFVKSMQAHTLDAKEQSDQANKNREFQQKSQELGLKHEENAIKREQLAGDKVDKWTKDMKNDLDADKGRAGNFGVISGKVQSAERLQTLIGAFKDGNLPGAQTEELALGLANMLSPGGGGSREQVKALVPSSVVGDTNKIKSWFLNEPTGAGQQKFIEAMANTIDREKETATNQLNQIRVNRLTAHDGLRKRAPDQYNAVLQSYGIDPSNIKNGKYVAPASAADTKVWQGTTYKKVGDQWVPQ